MTKVGISIDYGDICKDYNTVYLDRDNTDPATTKCMREVMVWMKTFLIQFLEEFEFTIYNLNNKSQLEIDDIASKRFLFYSLEKEITLQNYVFAKEYKEYPMLSSWEDEKEDTVLIQNDEDGGCIYIYYNKDSDTSSWIKDQLEEFSIDEIPFETH